MVWFVLARVAGSFDSRFSGTSREFRRRKGQGQRPGQEEEPRLAPSGPSQRTIAPSSASVLQDFRVAEVGGESWVPPQQVARLARQRHVDQSAAPTRPVRQDHCRPGAPRQHSRKEADGIASPKVQLSERELPACDEAVVVAGKGGDQGGEPAQGRGLARRPDRPHDAFTVADRDRSPDAPARIARRLDVVF